MTKAGGSKGWWEAKDQNHSCEGGWAGSTGNQGEEYRPETELGGRESAQTELQQPGVGAVGACGALYFPVQEPEL